MTHSVVSVSSCRAGLPARSTDVSTVDEDLAEVVVATGNGYVVAYVGSEKNAPHGSTGSPTQPSLTGSMSATDLGDAFALFADDALEWAHHTSGAASESWPDA